MPVVAAYLYRNGERLRRVTIEERIHCPDDRSQFVWIGMCDPTAQEMEQLHLHYNLHPLAVEDALKANQLPKVGLWRPTVRHGPHSRHDPVSHRGRCAIL
jgi:magnesium transporter